MNMLGRWLREARRTAGMAQAEVARRSGVDRSYISDLERDLQTPSIHVLLRICRAMNVSAADIIREVERSEAKKQ